MSTRILVDEDEPAFDVDEPPFEARDVQIRKDKWVKDEYEIQDFLGRGKFGEVKRCTEISSGREYAAKFICSPRPQDKKDVEHEVNIMKKLRHKRLIQLYDAFEAKTEMCLILEIIYGGELFDRVISDDFILTEKACVALVRQICEGVEYMHNNCIIHLDMKPENILCLSKTGNRVKIIDFGLAREYHPKKDLRVLFGTPEFMAPEVVQYEPINYGTDMWSIGVICYVLLSGLSPFMGDTDADTLTNVIKSLYDFNYAEFDDVSDDAKDLITKLLMKDRNKRLSATDCLNHRWLQKPRSSASSSPSLSLTKKRLKRFVYRRKWQKIVNAIIAVRRMGFSLSNPTGHGAIPGQFVTNNGREHKTPTFGLDADAIDASLAVRTFDISKRKASDSGYESVAVDKETSKDGLTENDETPSTTTTTNDTRTTAKPPRSPNDVSKSTKFTLPSPSKVKDKKGVDGKQKSSSAKDSSQASSAKKSVMEKFGGLFTNHKDTGGTLKKDKSSKKDKNASSKKNKEKEKATFQVGGGLVKKDSMKRKVGPKPKLEVYVSTPAIKKKDILHKHSSKTNASDSPAEGNGTNSNRGNNDVTRAASPPATPSGEEEEEPRTPTSLLGNVKNKRRLFENNGRFS